MSLVLDSSVAIAWCFEEEQTPALMALLGGLGASGAVAPSLWPLEVTNTLVLAARRSRVDAAKRDGLIRFLRGLPVALDDGTAERAWSETVALAASHGLTVYDAAYLELAIRRSLPMATLDGALRRAAAAVGVALAV